MYSIRPCVIARQPDSLNQYGNTALAAHMVDPLSNLHMCVYPQKNAGKEFALVGRMSL